MKGFDGFYCDGPGCDVKTNLVEYWSPFGGMHPAPRPPWIHEEGGRLHFCSESCEAAHELASEERRRQRHNARRREKRAEAVREPKLCAVCGKPFTPARADAKTCSAAHRKALSRSKQAAGSAPS